MRTGNWFRLPLFTCLGASLFVSIAVARTPQTATQRPVQTPTPQVKPTIKVQEPAKQNDEQAQAIIKQAEAHYLAGDKLFKQGDIAEAQKEFDAALRVLDSLENTERQSATITEYYGKLLEKINSHASDPTAEATPQQEKFDKSELDEISKIDLHSENLKLDPMKIKPGQYDFQFEITPPVAQFIAYFTEGRGRATMEHGLQRSGQFRQMAERIFKEEGVPNDLIWLAQVESVWKPLALSYASAKGIWQFIPSTGLEYGLSQTAYLDDRSNPEKETRAAARYLKYLSDYFAGDWLLAMAAYNGGAGRVESAIGRCGFADFWEIHQRGLLMQQTQNYVPAILATIVVAKNAKQFGFDVKPDPAWAYDTYELPSQTDLRVVADLLHTSVDTIQEYNPELRRLVTPPGSFTVRLPKGTVQQFALAYAELPGDKRLRQDIIIPYRNLDRPSIALASYTTHRVVRGETLGRIAGKMGVSQAELARLNGMRANSQLRNGQTIRVPRRGPTYRSKNISRRSSGHAARSGHATRKHRRR